MMVISELTEAALKQGETYRAKRYKEFFGSNNDRTIIHINRDKKLLQYDSDTVKIGRNFPTVTFEQFLRWANDIVCIGDLRKGEKK